MSGEFPPTVAGPAAQRSTAPKSAASNKGLLNLEQTLAAPENRLTFLHPVTSIFREVRE